MISADDYVGFLGREYLDGYVSGGGCAVKFAVADPAEAGALREGLVRSGQAAGYVVASVDAATTRAHLIEQIFFEVARQVDWDGLAATALRHAVSEAGYEFPGPDVSGLDDLAAHHGADARELKRDVDLQLQQHVFRDYSMVQEFRIAMLRLCQAAFRTGQVSDAEHAAVLEWLRGDLHQMAALKSSLIYRKIARHNARQVLFSLPHWIAKNGGAGLLLVIDAQRLGVARRPPVDQRTGQYYTRLSLLDAYEVLRQLVDSTDELSRCCVVVIAAPELLTDEVRGLDAYQALKMRIFNEVRDRRRDNPFSSLVRIGQEEMTI
ncbi:MAG: BREX system ATP-binding domain-containing protein [Acidimicrobiales bacterium]